jgi:hypothetical protein
MKKLLTGDDLVDFAKRIQSKQEFEYFMACLVEDYFQNKIEWENDNLENYLIGINKFAVDMKGYYENSKQDVDVNIVTWRIVAEMLLAASVYGN